MKIIGNVLGNVPEKKASFKDWKSYWKALYLEHIINRKYLMSRRITIKDIAQVLNISTSTVSRALADRWDVNPETRKAVLEVAEQLNYHPNPISLSLRNQQTFTIGVVLPEFVNSYFAEVMIGIQSVLSEKGYNILVAQSNETFTTETKNIDLFEKTWLMVLSYL